MIADTAFWKGSTTLETLLELVHELRELKLKHKLTIHIVHVAERLMISQGTDTLFRGYHNTRAMADININKYTPLHLSALEKN